MSQTKDSNPKSAAATTRLSMSLFPDTAIAYGALGMTEGNYKYRGYNFRDEGVRVSTYIDALKRHTAKFYAGDWADPVTGVPHLASMISCCAILIDGFVKGNINDDRPPALDMQSLLDEFEGHVRQLQECFGDTEAFQLGQITEKELESKRRSLAEAHKYSETVLANMVRDHQ